MKITFRSDNLACMSSPSTLSNPMERSNPRHLRLAYISSFLVQTFDCFLFIILSPQLFTDQSILTGPTQFWIRANATTLFPFVSLIFLLRHHHVSSDVGRRVVWMFTLFHGLVLLLQAWILLSGRWHMDLFWASVAFHGTWFASGMAAIMGY